MIFLCYDLTTLEIRIRIDVDEYLVLIVIKAKIKSGSFGINKIKIIQRPAVI
jgi:hypothetical protein